MYEHPKVAPEALHFGTFSGAEDLRSKSVAEVKSSSETEDLDQNAPPSFEIRTESPDEKYEEKKTEEIKLKRGILKTFTTMLVSASFCAGLIFIL